MWGVVIGVTVVAVAVVVFVLTRSAPSRPAAVRDEGLSSQQQASKTVAPVPSGLTVPEANTANVPSGVAKPEIVSQVNVGGMTDRRAFSVRIENGRFDPSEIIVHAKDMVDINFTAVDRPYDVVQPDTGYQLTLAKGETKLLEGWFPSPAKYTIYCPTCGGPDKGPVGYIIAVPK